MTAALAPEDYITPATRDEISRLPLGLAILVLQLHGGAIARAWADELRMLTPPGFHGPTAEDACTAASLGLAITADRRMQLTGKGALWARALMRGGR